MIGKRYYKWGYIFMLLITSCTNNYNRNDVNEDEIRFSISEGNKKQSDVFYIDTIIKLETLDSSLIGYVSNILSKTSGFYIADQELSQQIVKFDRNGKYLYSINRQGRGPGEFLKLTYFCVDFLDNYLYLYDSKQKKIICFNSKTGKFMYEFSINFYAASFHILPNNKDFIFYFNNIPNKELKIKGGYPQFVITNNRGKVLKKIIPFDKNICIPKVSFWNDVFTTVDSTLYCFSLFSDAIYSINNNNDFKNKYYLNYLNNNTKRLHKLMGKIKTYEGINFERNRQDCIDAGIYQLFKINFSKKYFFFSGNHKNIPFFYLYNQETSLTEDLSALIPDVTGENLYFNTSDEESFYIILPILLLKEEAKKNSNIFNQKVLQIINDLNENDNPLIIKINIL